jgi:hypothetical protein
MDNSPPSSDRAGDPPYAADARSKGWRFELDLERIQQSDTWAIAPADVRPWLLMLWATAWQQNPCGTLPSDEQVLCARLGMVPKMWGKHRSVLLRGWRQCSDGRLYHAVITERVLGMLTKKESEKARKAEYRLKMEAERARLSAVVPQLSHGTDVDVPRPSASCDDTGTGTGTGTGTQSNTYEAKASLSAEPTGVEPQSAIQCGDDGKARKRATPLAKPADVDQQVWSDWLALRKAKRAPVTDTVVSEATAEAQKAGLTLEAFLRVWCARGSQGLQADWLKPAERVQQPAMSYRERDAELARQTADKWMGSYAPRRADPNTIDMEENHETTARITQG